MSVPYTSYIEINVQAIAQNVQVIRQHVGANVMLMAVVKANGYGHGAVTVAKTALAHGASWLGVARVREGIELREAGITAPILILSYAIPAEMAQVAAYDLTPTVTEIEVAWALAACGKEVAIHLKVDTGMGRAGLLPGEVVPFLQAVAGLPYIRVGGIFTHFAVGDSPHDPFTHQQLVTFQDVLNQVAAAGYTGLIRHAANSGGIMYHPAAHLDMVRAGIALYGLRPDAKVEPGFPIQPVLSLKSHVARVRTLPAGASVGYGRTYVASEDRTIALIPLGYGDGIHRLLSHRAAVLIRGQRAPLVGRVSMDQITADVSQIPGVTVHDEVVLIGQQGQGEITADEVAQWAETINYEVTTSLMARLPRVEVGEVG